MPHCSQAWQNVSQAAIVVASGSARERNATREWSSKKVRILATSPVAIAQSVTSVCHNSFGADASNRRIDDFGRFCGAGTMNPCRCRIRQIVDSDGNGFAPRWIR